MPGGSPLIVQGDDLVHHGHIQVALPLVLSTDYYGHIYSRNGESGNKRRNQWANAKQFKLPVLLIS
jgi:hypothetical protein